MTLVDPRDRLPLLAAVLIMLVGNVVVFALGATMYFTVFAAPFAVVAFGLTRYLLHGSPYPVGVRGP
jgi:hypothetical protein